MSDQSAWARRYGEAIVACGFWVFGGCLAVTIWDKLHHKNPVNVADGFILLLSWSFAFGWLALRATNATRWPLVTLAGGALTLRPRGLYGEASFLPHDVQEIRYAPGQSRILIRGKPYRQIGHAPERSFFRRWWSISAAGLKDPAVLPEISVSLRHWHQTTTPAPPPHPAASKYSELKEHNVSVDAITKMVFFAMFTALAAQPGLEIVSISGAVYCVNIWSASLVWRILGLGRATTLHVLCEILALGGCFAALGYSLR